MTPQEACVQAFENGKAQGYAKGYNEGKKVATINANWKYHNKQNIAVCTNCSFERNLDHNFGKAIACPNCGAVMNEKAK